MILTITPNTALDKVLFVDDFAFGQTVRATGAAEGMGGKGAVVSWVLGQIGTPSLATGLAAGETGRRMEARLQAEGVRTDFIWVGGETRTNYVLARTRDGVQGTVTVDGLQVTPDDSRRLTEHVLSLLPQASLVFCGGSLPGGREVAPAMPLDWYVPIIRAAQERGILTMLDTSDRFLAPNVAALPDIIKPNASEAATLLGHPVSGPQQAAAAVRELQARGIRVPVITLGEQGAVAGTDEGVFFVPPLQVRVLNTAGAGDGFSAGLIQARLQGKDWREALRWAAAVATAALITPGTGVCRLEDAQALYPHTRVEQI
ncbi:MAG: hexose kinase [Chloroflexi bacterium]|nr:hexose kinase [Chloroflexota bacterium]